MAKPVLQAIKAFDAVSAHNITFSYTGQISKIEAIFYDNSTNAEIYGSGVFCITQKNTYVLPANCLSNTATAYYVKLRVYDSAGTASLWSDSVLFYCKSTPTFGFSNITYDGVNPVIIQTASYMFECSYTYSVPHAEVLNYYTIYFYDFQKNLISTSEKYYDINSGCIINNFEQGQTYFVRAIAITINGMEIDTGYIELLTNYATASAYSKIQATNRYQNGDVSLNLHIISVDGECSKTPVYVSSANGSAVDLSDGSTVTYSSGFGAAGDYVLGLLLKNVNDNCKIIQLSNGTILVNVGVCTRAGVTFAYLQEPSTGYIVESNNVVRGVNPIAVYIKRVSGVYSISIAEQK